MIVIKTDHLIKIFQDCKLKGREGFTKEELVILIDSLFKKIMERD